MGRNIKLSENSAVYFDGLTHTYLRRGDYKELIGVTSLMKKYGLGADYRDIPADVLQKAAERGSAVHGAIETWCKGMEVEINETYAEEVIPDLEAFKRLELPVLANEYLVSDNELVASSIDIVLKDLTLVDIKTTSKVHRDAVSWQLSIYKWLFELQNPKKKVKCLKCLHLRGGKCEYIDIEEKPREQILGLIEAYKDGLDWAAPGSEGLAPLTPEQQRVVALLEELERRITTLDTQVKDYKRQQEEQKAAVLKFMSEHGITKWEVTPTLSFTRVAPTTRQAFDSKRFQADHPDTYGQYLKTSEVKETLKINIK